MLTRRETHCVRIGSVSVGGHSPIVVQSMTDTNTSDVDRTVEQIIQLYEAGSEMVRVTVNDIKAAEAIPEIQNRLKVKHMEIPLIGCFHYNGHTLLTNVPECAIALAKYRINPGNVGFGQKRDSNFEQIIEIALRYDKPVRIGVNWGSLDQELAEKMMNDNAKRANPLSAEEVMCETIVQSTLISAAKAEDLGMSPNKIILSAKVSRIQDLIQIYQKLSDRSSYALHLGLTEAGMGMEGIVATTGALSIILQEGIGDTIRASITPKPGAPRTDEVELCKQVLQSLGVRNFKPSVTSCPGCGRTSSDYFRRLTDDIQSFIAEQMPKWQGRYKGVENMKIAVMGCIVNGPGESKHADIGISLPGSGEKPIAPVFIGGEKRYTLRGDTIAQHFKEILIKYVEERYGS